MECRKPTRLGPLSPHPQRIRPIGLRSASILTAISWPVEAGIAACACGMWKQEYVIAHLRGHTDIVSSVCFRSDGRRLASSSYDLSVRQWDVETRQCQGSLTGHTDLIESVIYSPDGNSLASASFDHTVRLWDARQRACAGPF